MAVFYDILDLREISYAHIVFKDCTSSKIAQRKIMEQQAEELRAEFMEGKRAAFAMCSGSDLGPKMQICKQGKSLVENSNKNKVYNLQAVSNKIPNLAVHKTE